jgi:predicted transcriptional regulator
VALSLNDLKKGKAGKTSSSSTNAETRRMVRPWEDPTKEPQTSLEQQVTNGEQTGDKRGTNGEQTGDKEVMIARRTEEKQVTERVTSKRVNREQTDYKQVTKSGFEQLRGHESRLLQLIFAECQANGELLTPPLTLDRIAESLGSRKETAKTVIVRLTKKGLVKRENSATGRGGFTRFRLEKTLYQELLIRETGNKRVTNREQTGNKRDTQRVTEQVTEPSSSSSSLRSTNIQKLLTTGDLTSSESTLDTPWQEIDYSDLTELRFGRNQLVQIVRDRRLTPEQLQDSIYAFAFDLSENQKAKHISGAPLNYFMGILRKGPYAPPANYESPEARQLRLYLEVKEQQQKRQHEIEARLETVEFEEWAEKLSLDKRDELVPPKDYAKSGGTAHTMQLREYFRENVWPLLKQKLQQSGTSIDERESHRELPG